MILGTLLYIFNTCNSFMLIILKIKNVRRVSILDYYLMRNYFGRTSLNVEKIYFKMYTLFFRKYLIF